MIKHHPSHWIAVALVAGLGLLAFEVAGQDTTSTGMFQGRPALAGAQGGLGAQAGPPQGGIGLQGSEGAQLTLRPPRAIREEIAAARDCSRPTASAAENPACLPEVANEGLERRLAILGLPESQQRGRM